jgi:hypothetical protein
LACEDYESYAPTDFEEDYPDADEQELRELAEEDRQSWIDYVAQPYKAVDDPALETAYRLTSIWDLGQDGLVFASYSAITGWLTAHEAVEEMAKDSNQTVIHFLLASQAEGSISRVEVAIIE